MKRRTKEQYEAEANAAFARAEQCLKAREFDRQRTDCRNCGGAGFSIGGGDCPACKGTGREPQ